MFSFGPLEWVLLTTTALLVGIAKTGVPGLGIIIMPILMEIMPAKAAVGFLLPMLITGDIVAVAYYKRHALWNYLIKLLPSALAGIVAGYFLLDIIDDATLKPVVGAVILLILGIRYLRERRRVTDDAIPDYWWFSTLVGFIAGVLTMLANMAGPLMVIYLLSMRLPKERFIGTAAWYFLILNCIKVPFNISLGLITFESLTFNAYMIPVILLGTLGGIFILKKIPQRIFDVSVQILAAAGALKLFF